MSRKLILIVVVFALLLVSFVYERTGGFGALFMAMAALAAVVTLTGALLPAPMRRSLVRPAAAE